MEISRRGLLLAGIAATVTGPAFAQDATDAIPGFDDALAGGGPILVHATATWCEVCQAQKLILATLLATPDFVDMKMFEVDFDTQKAVLRRYEVQQQSTMIVFKDGAEIDRQVGQTDPEVIETLLRKVL